MTYGYTYGAGPTYDLKDQARSIAYPGGVGTVNQSWNADGTLASVTDWNGKQTTFSYDADQNQTGQTAPSTTNVTDTFRYNAADQMSAVSDSNGTMLFSATYTLDGNGQITSDNSQPSSQARYKYTSLNQVCYAASAASNACTSPPSNSYPYSYDNADNLTTMENAAHTATNTQQYNNADQLCWTIAGSSSNSCSSTPTGATTYTYDNKGNRTHAAPATGAQTCNTYDQANQLTQIQTGTGATCTTPTTVAGYTYDGDGIRQSKTVGSTTTQFAWDGAGANLLQQNNGTTTTSFIYGPGGIPVEQIAGSTTTYLHHDQLGSIRLITDAAGATTTASKESWDPYGNQVTSTGSLTTPFGYAGQYTDPETGLQYDRARYYDPTTAQFLSQDPALATTRQPYQYTNENPLNTTDPSGLASTVVCEEDGACLPVGPPTTLSDSPGGAGGALINAGSDVINTEAQFWGQTVPCAIGSLFGDGCGASSPTAPSPEYPVCPQVFLNAFASIAGPGALIFFARGADLPARGQPGSTAVRDDGQGNGQIRDYGPDGRATTDFDFGHDHSGAGDPHAHDWDWSSPPRQPARPIGPGE